MTNEDINGDGMISFQEYRELVIKHPTILNSLTLNLNDSVANTKT